MKYPVMGKNPEYAVQIDALDGGINLYDDVTGVADTQLTDAENMWYDKGLLSTRPGIVRSETRLVEMQDGFVAMAPQRINDTTVVCVFAKKTAIVVSVSAHFIKNDGTEMWYRQADIRMNTLFTPQWHFWLERTDYDTSGTPKDRYMCILPDGKLLITNDLGGFDIVEPYVPIIKQNIIGAEYRPETTENGVINEPYNALTGDYRFQCTTTDSAKVWKVPGPIDGNSTYSYKFTYMNRSTMALETITRPLADGVTEPTYDPAIFGFTTGIAEYPRVKIGSNKYSSGHIDVAFWACNASGSVPTPAVTFPLHNQDMQNNLEITVHNAVTKPPAAAGMTLHAWYSGGGSGAQGGTRLFLAGYNENVYGWHSFTEPDENIGIVCWSAAGRTNYFPENNYVKMRGKVTALGRQDSILVIFGKNETNYLQYYANTVTEDDVAAGADTEALRAQFMLRPLHPTIGCDCPNSVRLVSNRLVWAHTSGHVYSLTSSNQYNERNVRCISTLIEPITVPANCFGGEYSQHYMLLLGNNTVWVLDTDNSAYNSFAYYASEKRAERMLPWYKWVYGISGSDSPLVAIIADGDNMAMIGTEREVILATGHYMLRAIFTVSGYTDAGAPIRCRFKSKHFDFKVKDKKKCVNRLYIEMKAEDGAKVRIKSIQDGRETEIARVIGSGNAAPESRRFFVNGNMLRTFGFGMESDGNIAIAGAKIKYTQKGVIR